MFKKILSFFTKKDKLEQKVKQAGLAEQLQKSFKAEFDQSFLTELEEILLKADFGVKATQEIIAELAKQEFAKNTSFADLTAWLKNYLTEQLESFSAELKLEKKPYVILVSGVNGSGKTTSLGKIAHLLNEQGKKTVLVAADTFRAAAGNQLKTWAERSNTKIIMAEKEGADAAALAYQGLKFAQDENYDVVLIDTAGRLQNQQNFMAQLTKMLNVLKKLDETAPHSSLLVIDGTTGQNALRQAEIFKDHAEVSGLIVTKLDGTAKGGVLVPLSKEFNLPIYFIGKGEGIADLQKFKAAEFVAELLD